MMIGSFSTVALLVALYVLTASASISFVAAQNQTEMITTEQLYGKISSDAAQPGFNVEGGSVFQNYVDAVNNKQYFFRATGSAVFEKPGAEPVQYTTFNWCSDLTFSDVDMINSSTMGLAGRCIQMFLAGYTEAEAAGSTLEYEYSGEWTATLGISAMFVEQQNMFEGQYHSNVDDFVLRYFDDGRKIVPQIGWEGHDEGDMAPNAATASWSAFGDITWMSLEEVAQLFNTTVDEFTSEKFKQAYKDTWSNSTRKKLPQIILTPKLSWRLLSR